MRYEDPAGSHWKDLSGLRGRCATVRRLGRDIVTLTGAWDVPEDESRGSLRGVFAFEDYIRQLIADRRHHPQDDLTTDFIQAGDR